MENQNYDDAIEVAPGIFWVGFYDKDATFTCNPYLIVDGDEAVLIDCGSLAHFPIVARKVFGIVSPSQISHLVFQHMDPDLCAALPLFKDIIDRPDLKMVAHWRSSMIISYYSTDKLNFYNPEKNGGILKLASGRVLRAIPAHYLHTPGTINMYDEKNKVLFTSDIFAAFTPEWEIFADASYPEKMRLFHENYMPSSEIMNEYLNRIKALDIEMLCPQHGSVIQKELISPCINALAGFEYGKFINE